MIEWDAFFGDLRTRCAEAAAVARGNATDLDAFRADAQKTYASDVAEAAGSPIEWALLDAAERRLAWALGPLGRNALFSGRAVVAKAEFHEALAELADRAGNGNTVTSEEWYRALDGAAAHPAPDLLARAIAANDVDEFRALLSMFGAVYA